MSNLPDSPPENGLLDSTISNVSINSSNTDLENTKNSKTTNEKSKNIFSGRVLWYLGFVIIVALIGIGALLVKTASTLEAVAPAASATTNRGTSTQRPVTITPDGIIKVYITGEIRNPGVYQMQAGDRILDVVQAAGGFTEQADQNRVEQAARVRDEMRIAIPALGQPAAVNPPTATTPETTNPPSKPTPTSAAKPGGSKVNINTASAADLDKLPGIGATISQRIIDYRTANGPFKNLDDLRKVEGISKSVLDKIKDLIDF